MTGGSYAGCTEEMSSKCCGRGCDHLHAKALCHPVSAFYTVAESTYEIFSDELQRKSRLKKKKKEENILSFSHIVQLVGS